MQYAEEIYIQDMILKLIQFKSILRKKEHYILRRCVQNTRKKDYVNSKF